jgi:hypothetical protein
VARARWRRGREGGDMPQVKVKVKIRKLEKIETTGQRDERIG